MTAKERRLLRIALVIFIGYMLPFQLGPATYHLYQNYRNSIDDLFNQIERYEKLGERAEYWETENQRAKQALNQVETGILSGNSRELVGARMQSLVRQLAQDAGMTFKTLEPPDTSLHTGEWMLVIQSMQFEANSKTLMTFLQAMDDAEANFKVVSLDVRSYRKKLSGTIKMTGFSRIPPPRTEPNLVQAE